MKEEYFRILKEKDILLGDISNQTEFFMEVEDIDDPDLDEEL
jgi:hypothetical protein